MTARAGTVSPGPGRPTGSSEDLEVVVAEVDDAAIGVRTLTLQARSGDRLPDWTPGAHIDVTLPTGAIRQYSLCGDPSAPDEWRIGVYREPPGTARGGSEYIHTAVEVGTSLTVGHPRNTFPLVDSPRLLFIAGGIGITPILPMVARAAELGADWTLVYGGRSVHSMAFRDELAAYGSRVEFVSEEQEGRIAVDRILAEPRDDTAVYCCGPSGLLEAVEVACSGWPAGTLHSERFAPTGFSDPGTDRAFDVVLARRNQSFAVPPGESILNVLESNGVDVLSSCQQGMCGRCEQTVLEGEPDHRDEILTPEEHAAGYIQICVSRSLGDRLVLDL